MKSAWRGEARGMAPKRIRSARGPPVWISSMPQQARPKSRYQSEFSRAMLMSRSSWLVWKRVTSPPIPESSLVAMAVSSLLALRRPAGRVAGLGRGGRVERLDPLQVAPGPDPGQADHQDGDEEEQLVEGDPRHGRAGQRPLLEDRHHREGQGDVDLEDHEDQGHQVEARVEVEPRHPDGALAALVDGALLGVGDARADQPRGGDTAQREADGDDR